MIIVVFHHHPCYRVPTFWDKMTKFVLDFLDKNYRHCFIAKPLGGGRWLVLSGGFSNYKIELQDEVWWQGILALGIPWVAVPTLEGSSGWKPRLTMSCVTMVKQYLGIWQPFILTPKQLFQYLKGKENGTRY